MSAEHAGYESQSDRRASNALPEQHAELDGEHFKKRAAGSLRLSERRHDAL
jgi:hypothetical protein